MIKHALILAILLATSDFYVYAQSQIIPVTSSIELFKTANILHEKHHYNTDFILLNGIKSIQLESQAATDESDGTLFTQYNFNLSGEISEKIYFRKTGETLDTLSERKYSYDDEDKLVKIEDYYEGIFDLATHYIYIGDLLDKVYEENTEGETGNWSKYHHKGRQLARKITHQNDQVKYVEYHLPATTLPARIDSLYSMEKRESNSKNVYFYLYENGQRKRETWYAPKGKSMIDYDYNRDDKPVTIKQTEKKGTVITYKYEAENLEHIKEKRHKQPTIIHRYTYDETGTYVIQTETKRGNEVLENLNYHYEFWETLLEEVPEDKN